MGCCDDNPYKAGTRVANKQLHAGSLFIAQIMETLIAASVELRFIHGRGKRCTKIRKWRLHLTPAGYECGHAVAKVFNDNVKVFVSTPCFLYIRKNSARTRSSARMSLPTRSLKSICKKNGRSGGRAGSARKMIIPGEFARRNTE